MASSARIDELRKKFDENPRRYFAPLANEYRKAGDLEQAIFICQEYLPQQPGHMSGHIVYGQALFEQGQFDAARGVFETALSLDPENLIALRHLGDIARQAGDTSGARVWYQRVLEADPRNEEIAQLMMSLLSTPAGTPVVDHAAPTPLSTPVVAPAAEMTAPARPTPINSYTPSLSEHAVAPSEAAAPQPSPFAPPPTPEPGPEAFVSRHAPSEDELLDLDSFDLGGVPLSSLRSSKTDEDVGYAPTPPGTDAISFADAPADPPSEPAAPVVDEVGADEHSPVEADAGTDVEIEKSEEFSGEFEADPYAVAARQSDEATADQPAEFSAALDATSSLDTSDTLTEDAIPSDGVPMEGLEVFESGLISGRTPGALDAVEGLSTESFYDAPAEMPGDEPSAFVDDRAAFIAPSVEEIAPPPESGDDDAPVAEEAQPEAVAQVETTVETTVEPAPETESEAEPASPEPVAESQPAPPPALGTPRFNVAMTETPSLAELSASPPFGAEAFDSPPDVADVAEPADAVESIEEEASTISDAEAAPEPVAEPASAFVTETMATLYLEQGHYDAALDIYRQLVAQRPEDIGLRERLHAAEARAWGKSQELGASIVDDEILDDAAPMEGAPVVYDGPTIRDFLSSVIFGRGAEQGEAAAGEYASDPAVAVEEPPVAEATVEPMLTASSVERETVRGSLGALFSEADAAAQAVSEPLTTHATPLAGAPAHRAASELSLDHVFKTGTAPRRSTDEFSFDQFFAEDSASASDAAAPPEPSSTEATGAREPADDIAQFNAWLNGLKKS